MPVSPSLLLVVGTIPVRANAVTQSITLDLERMKEASQEVDEAYQNLQEEQKA